MILAQLRRAIAEKTLRNGANLTTLDVLKLIGVVTITADHIGYFFFPEDLWWRVVGHGVSPALWFFLVGYSKQRHIDAMWCWYAAIMTLQFLLLGGVPLLPPNIFFSFIVCRWWLNLCEDRGYLATPLSCVIVCLMGLALVLPTDSHLLHYGTAGLLYGMLGRLVRERKRQLSCLVGAAAAAACLLSFYHGWPLTTIQATVLLVFTIAMTSILIVLENRIVLKDWQKNSFTRCLALFSRNTMHYFYVHVLVLHIAWRVLEAR